MTRHRQASLVLTLDHLPGSGGASVSMKLKADTSGRRRTASSSLTTLGRPTAGPRSRPAAVDCCTGPISRFWTWHSRSGAVRRLGVQRMQSLMPSWGGAMRTVCSGPSSFRFNRSRRTRDGGGILPDTSFLTRRRISGISIAGEQRKSATRAVMRLLFQRRRSVWTLLCRRRCGTGVGRSRRCSFGTGLKDGCSRSPSAR